MSSISLAEGTVFAGDYRVVRPLGDGGMGAVFVVEQLSTGRRRALKVMRAETVRDAASRRRFEQEARVGAAIKSDHVVEVIAAGVDEASGMPWLAMELLDGEDLAHTLARRGPLPLSEVSEIFGQLCHALSAAHAAGVVHRDLKPENLFIAVARQEGKPFLLKVLDFGIAKVVGEVQSRATGAIGTPHWMSPEQTVPGGEIAPAADIWPLGLIAFRLLTGRMFWRGDSPMAVLREVAFEPIPRASERAEQLGVASCLPQAFDAWFEKCVAREPRGRFRSVAEARDAFRALVTGDTATLRSLTGPVVLPALTVEDASLGTGEWIAKQESGEVVAPTAPMSPAETPAKTTLETAAGAVKPPTGEPPPVAAVSASADKGGTQAAVTLEPAPSLPGRAPSASALPAGRSRTGLVIAGLAAAAVVGGVLWFTVLSPDCPSGMVWDGRKCMGARYECPDGQEVNGNGRCAAAQATAAPADASASPSASATASASPSAPGGPASAGAAQGSCPPKMVSLAGGTFRMGERGDRATVAAFCMDITEVTVEAYTSCVRSGVCMEDGNTCPHALYGSKDGRDRPINCVTADQAQRYCTSKGKRLPTEEEWEWAARGGAEGRLYPWGDAKPKDQLCWVGEGGTLKRADQGPCPVGAFPAGATAQGLLDMAGNIYEWTSSPYQEKQFRSCRGGSYISENESTVTTTFRLRCIPNQHYYNIGFRCAADP